MRLRRLVVGVDFGDVSRSAADRCGEKRARDRQSDVIVLRGEVQSPSGDLPPAAVLDRALADSVEGDAA